MAEVKDILLLETDPSSLIDFEFFMRQYAISAGVQIAAIATERGRSFAILNNSLVD